MRLLVVEDEIKLARAIARGLELQHYAVDICHDGQEAISLASTEEYDVLILDVMLPKVSGLEICQQLRSTGVQTRILMLTARSQVNDKVIALDAGADDYLTKPFSFEELFSRIRALMRRTSINQSPILKARDLELDPQKLTVTRADQQISLSAREFAIVEFLLRHKNRVVSKEKIVQHVWDYDADVLPTTVEVHIKNIRDKIDRPFPIPVLKTLRGFGYEIVDKE
jgi:DNA-binding response OmpR family regulator